MKKCPFCTCKEQHFHAEGGLVVTLTGLKKLEAERDSLRTQLAEAHALLREVHEGMWPSNPLTIKIGSHLSASAEPSAPAEPTELQKAVDELSKVPASWQAEFNTRVLCILRILARAQK